ncbi:hypothetical protein QFC21_004766 [Naganishia friedmannii]|uniref:Uncharacterized protein n=1 Tax=Naganishia friedmannii TaxID=89922 RepID=A0ACC2VFA2_9TREE|nr:hypothetical protein QFC21_004766 [Naganishia friedmannii]
MSFGGFTGFGAKPAATAATPSLFGQQPAQQPQQQQQTSLFGQSAQAQQPGQTAPGGFGFGATNTTQQQQQPGQTGGGLFAFKLNFYIASGASTNTNNGLGGSSLFGNNNANSAATPSFGLGNVGGNVTQQNLGLGQSQMYNYQQPQQPYQQQQQAPWQSGLEPQLQLDSALMVDVPGDMLFEDIEKKHPQLAQWILGLEQEFAKERRLRDGIDTQGLGTKLLEDRQEIRRIESVTKSFETCVEVVQVAKTNAATGGSTLVQHKNFYLHFFQQLATEMKEQMIRYRKTLDQIERGLMSLQRIQHMPTPQAIATAVSNNQETIMSLAGEIAGLEERIKNLAAFYRQEFRAKMNTVVDPFVLARTEAGEPALGHSGKRGERPLNDDIDGLNVL